MMAEYRFTVSHGVNRMGMKKMLRQLRSQSRQNISVADNWVDNVMWFADKRQFRFSLR